MTNFIRPHFAAATNLRFGVSDGRGLPNNAWVISRHLIGPDGHVVAGQLDIKALCPSVIDHVSAGRCLSRLGYHSVATYQPPARYWAFQSTEAGLFVVLATVLVIVAVLYTLRRDA